MVTDAEMLKANTWFNMCSFFLPSTISVNSFKHHLPRLRCYYSQLTKAVSTLICNTHSHQKLISSPSNTLYTKTLLNT